jgi:hypothetical protein
MTEEHDPKQACPLGGLLRWEGRRGGSDRFWATICFTPWVGSGLRREHLQGRKHQQDFAFAAACGRGNTKPQRRRARARYAAEADRSAALAGVLLVSDLNACTGNKGPITCVKVSVERF